MASRPTELVAYLETFESMMPERQHGWKYQSYEGLVLAEGQPFFKGVRYERFGQPRYCYSNAFLASSTREDWKYVEGYAWSEGLIPVLHAWCVDSYGVVIETTWPDDRETMYYGIILPTQVQIMSMAKTEKIGVLPGDWELGFPLLRGGLDSWLSRVGDM